MEFARTTSRGYQAASCSAVISKVFTKKGLVQYIHSGRPLHIPHTGLCVSKYRSERPMNDYNSLSCWHVHLFGWLVMAHLDFVSSIVVYPMNQTTMALPHDLHGAPEARHAECLKWAAQELMYRSLARPAVGR